MASEYFGNGRTIVTDNFFTTSTLGQELWEKKTFLLGTVRKNRVDNPGSFVKELPEVLLFTYKKHDFRKENRNLSTASMKHS